MKKTITLAVLLLFALNLCAQTTIWAEQGTALKTEYGNGIAHDNNGNIYITGTFQDSVRFDTELLIDGFGTYCAKYDTSGNIVWAKKSMGGDGVVFDGSGHLYLFKNDSRDLQKIDLNGNLIWSQNIFTPTIFGSNGIQDVFVKGTDVYVTGYYGGNALFSNDTIYNTNAIDGNWDIFIAKFDDNGANQWAITAGGKGLDKGYGLYVNNSDEIYAVGYFKDTADFDMTQLISNSVQDMYLAKYSSTGSLLWANNYGGPGFDLSADIIADNSGDLYVNGRFFDSISFGNQTLYSVSVDAFVASFDSSGNPLWAHTVSGLGPDEEADIYIENSRLVFIATTAGDVTVDGLTVTGLGGLDICTGEFDLSGNIAWMKLLGGSSDDEGSGVCLYNGSIYFNGSFHATANFDNFTLNSQGQWDIVTGKIAVQNTTDVSSHAQPELHIYPNSLTEQLLIETDIYNGAIAGIFSMDGKLCRNISLQSFQTIVDMYDLSPGLYVVTVTGPSGTVSQKFMRP